MLNLSINKLEQYSSYGLMNILYNVMTLLQISFSMLELPLILPRIGWHFSFSCHSIHMKVRKKYEIVVADKVSNEEKQIS